MVGSEKSDCDWSRNRILEKLGKTEQGVSIVEVTEDSDSDHVGYLSSCLSQMTLEQAIGIVSRAVDHHKDDPNFPQTVVELLHKVHHPDQSEQEKSSNDLNLKLEAVMIKYHSPYEEVRAVTDPSDNPEEPVESIRAYILGIFWVIIGTAVNQFFSTRQPSVSVSASLLQLLVYPTGRLLATLIPDTSNSNNRLWRFLSPGPWTSKEQTLVTIMFRVSHALPYVGTQIIVQKLDVFYGHEWATVGYQFMLMISTQFLGFGIAGLARRFLVYPKECIWPSNLPILALNRALLRPESGASANGWTISRYRFFFIVFACSFLYFWFPNYLFTALSDFNWLSWISPGNHILGMITGMYGLGINPFPTLDWNIINHHHCLVTPFFSYANYMLGVAIAGAIFIPIIHFTNQKWSGYLPINTNQIFDNQGKPFDVKKVLSDGLFDQQKYRNYSPPFYSSASLVVYGAYFAYYPATIVYTLLYHRKALATAAKDAFTKKKSYQDDDDGEDYKDAHCRMMSEYAEVSNWWYLMILLAALALSITTLEVYRTETPVWSLFMAIALGIVFLIPIGLLESITNIHPGLNVLSELIAGYALPGKGTAMMIIKAFGYNTNAQALRFVSDLKLGHYAKIPPRAVFRCQVVATITSAIVTVGVINFQLSKYKGICTLNQPQKFTCPDERSFFSASVVWGVLGPKRVFEGLYPALRYCFLIGVFIPIPFFLAQKYGPFKRVTKFFHPLVILGGMICYAPYSISFYLAGFYMNYLSHRLVKRKYPSWWDRYNYILSSALDSGVALAAVVIFFAVQFNNVELTWWGNTVWRTGYDGGQNQQSYLQVPSKGFGPDAQHYP